MEGEQRAPRRCRPRRIYLSPICWNAHTSRNDCYGCPVRNEIVHLPTAAGMDGVYFDPQRKRVYVSGGRELPDGFAFIYQQKDVDHYELLGKIPTHAGAGTSFWSAEPDRYFVAAPASATQDAAILV